MAGMATSSSLFVSTRQELEGSIDQMKRAVRFASDEAVLRGRITRIRIKLDQFPQTLQVDYGPDEKFVLPSFLLDDLSKKSLLEKEDLEKDEKKLNQSFSPVSEFQDSPMMINENIRIRAIGTTLTNTVYTEGAISLFFYPSGEKNGGFILFSTDEEMATLTYEPFTNDVNEEFLEINTDAEDEEALDNYFQEKAKEYFNTWIK
jgi:hypothetical protein